MHIEYFKLKEFERWWYRKVKVLVTQFCPTLCDPMDCSPPVSSVHGILQTRILEWVAISYCRESSWPRAWTWVSCIAGSFFTIWATPGGMGRTLQPLLSPLIWEASMYPERKGASLFSKTGGCWEESEWMGLAKSPSLLLVVLSHFSYDFLLFIEPSVKPRKFNHFFGS